MSQKSKFSYIDVCDFILSKGCKLLTPEYKNAKQLLEIQCGCGNIYNTNFDSFKFKNKITCNECGFKRISKSRTLNDQYVKEYIKSKGCILLSDFINAIDKLKIQCKCGEIFYRSFNKFKSSNQITCLKCQNRTNWNYELVKNFIEVDSGSECILVSNNYINRNQKLNIICKCGKEFDVDFHSFLYDKQRQCYDCTLINLKTKLKSGIDNLKKYVVENSSSILLSNDYDNYLTTLDFKCNCGNIFKTSFLAFKNGKTKCDICSPRSQLEYKTECFLINNNIKYKNQYYFDDLRGIHNGILRFDFGILDENERLIFLLELDGEQHYFSSKQFGGEEAFQRNIKHDKLKNEYCKNNNIQLYRISYKQKKYMEDILNGIIYKHVNPVSSLN